MRWSVGTRFGTDASLAGDHSSVKISSTSEATTRPETVSTNGRNASTAARPEVADDHHLLAVEPVGDHARRRPEEEPGHDAGRHHDADGGLRRARPRRGWRARRWRGTRASRRWPTRPGSARGGRTACEPNIRTWKPGRASVVDDRRRLGGRPPRRPARRSVTPRPARPRSAPLGHRRRWRLSSWPRPSWPAPSWRRSSWPRPSSPAPSWPPWPS